MSDFVSAVEIREKFVEALSKLYESEVDIYSELLPQVAEFNRKTRGDGKPLVQVHHGAIRLGLASEMNVIGRLFDVMAMQPVNYYDLSEAGLPVHSTAFRDISQDGLEKNPFRVFVSQLREDLVPEEVRDKVYEVLNKRQIVNPRALELIDLHERNGGLTSEQADEFVKEAVETFRMHKEATVSKEFYEELLAINSLLADIVCFKTPHINHLTIDVDDIDGFFAWLNEQKIPTTPIVQGPPDREVNLFLRQMAVQAVKKDVIFPDGEGGFVEGEHRAPFAEYETKRCAAVTPTGRALYDKLLDATRNEVKDSDPRYMQVLQEKFSAFADSIEQLRKEGLVYFNYKVSDKAKDHPDALPKDLEQLIEQGYVELEPVHYHDFLPISAAGIFRSNLVEGGFTKTQKAADKRAELEAALGKPIIDGYDLYAAQEAASVLNVIRELSVDMPAAKVEDLKTACANDPAKQFGDVLRRSCN